MAFSMFDHDGDGSISVSEVMEVFHKLGVKVKASDVTMMFNKVDMDGKMVHFNPRGGSRLFYANFS